MSSLFLPILKPKAADVNLTFGGNRSTSQVQNGPPIEKRNNKGKFMYENRETTKIYTYSRMKGRRILPFVQRELQPYSPQILSIP